MGQKLDNRFLQISGNGKCAGDRDYLLEVLSFPPPAPDIPAIILIGRTNEAAGRTVGFDLACEYFGSRRKIFLYHVIAEKGGLLRPLHSLQNLVGGWRHVIRPSTIASLSLGGKNSVTHSKIPGNALLSRVH